MLETTCLQVAYLSIILIMLLKPFESKEVVGTYVEFGLILEKKKLIYYQPLDC